MRPRQHYQRKTVWIVAVFLLLVGALTNNAEARYTSKDSLFLQAKLPELIGLGDSLLENAATQPELYDHIQTLLKARNAGLMELSERIRTTSFDGIETQDDLDEIVLFKIGECLDAAETLPRPDVSDPDRALFAETMGIVPDLGFAPAPYLVLAAIEAVTQVAESIRKESAIATENVSSMALEVFDQAYSQMTSELSDDITANRLESLRHDSVVERLRCEKDGSNYRVRQIKNKLFADETFATMYFLRCNVCYQDRELWFPHIYLEKLLKAEKEQNLAIPPKAVDKNSGLEP